ncbi:MAG: CBS domain-containing protein [Bacteroidetes bacterium]|nr:CBS domain-containing protein [Bacteroidota bacterium]
MIAKDLINDAVIALRPTDIGSDALGLMDELRVSHLPVVNELEFIGLISDSDIYNRGEFEEAVWDGKITLSRPYIYENQHVYDAMLMITEQHLTLLPVLNIKSQYLGVITLTGLVQKLSAITSLNNPGGIIVLEINQKDYLLTEIAGIVESNDSRILSLYITSHPDSTKLELTIKVNRVDIGAILQTFYRYNYTVKASWSKEDSFTEGLQDRYDSLMNYLNI